MRVEASVQNQKAWEHLVYEWRIQTQGTPEELARKIKKSPEDFLRYHAEYFGNVRQKKIASICGSDGQRAVALALLGAFPTVFDISQPQKEYALQLAEAANVTIEYQVGDFCTLNKAKYTDCFDYTYCEGGILHYFQNLDLFFQTIRNILKPNGIMICSDYHPFQKTFVSEPPVRNVEMTHGNYFDTAVHKGHVPYAKYFIPEQQKDFPYCMLRFYTLSEICNAVTAAGLTFHKLYEHPRHDNDKIPGEFTIIAKK